MDKLNNVEHVSYLESNPTDLVGASGSVALSGAVEVPANEAAASGSCWDYLGMVVGGGCGGVPVEAETFYM